MLMVFVKLILNIIDVLKKMSVHLIFNLIKKIISDLTELKKYH